MNDFGIALKKARKTQRITLSQLSELVGKPTEFLSDIEQSRTQPPADRNLLANIEAVLNIDPGYLCSLSEQVRGIPRSIISQSRLNPKLSEVLLRADRDLTEEEFGEVARLLESYARKEN